MQVQGALEVLEVLEVPWVQAAQSDLPALGSLMNPVDPAVKGVGGFMTAACTKVLLKSESIDLKFSHETDY